MNDPIELSGDLVVEDLCPSVGQIKQSNEIGFDNDQVVSVGESTNKIPLVSCDIAINQLHNENDPRTTKSVKHNILAEPDNLEYSTISQGRKMTTAADDVNTCIENIISRVCCEKIQNPETKSTMAMSEQTKHHIFKSQKEYFEIEHGYSKTSAVISPQCVISGNEKEIVLIEEEHECPIPDVQNSFNTDFISSMIEVIDDAQENRDVKCIDVDSSEGSDDDSTSESSDTDSSSTESSSDESLRREDVALNEEVATLKNSLPPKVNGEILRSELPPVEDLHILLPEESVLECVGRITQITPDNTAVIKSLPNKPALDSQTVLFFSRTEAIGSVDEIFGPVQTPYYAVRFNDKDHLICKGVELEKEVYYAPHITDFTCFVFVSQLKEMQGSDASWTNDREPPSSCIDYSDDEQEREARKQRRNNRGQTENEVETSSNPDESKPRKRVCGRGRGRNRGRWHNNYERINMKDSSFDRPQDGWDVAVNGLSGINGEEYPQSQRHFNPLNLPPPPHTAGFNAFPIPPPPPYTASMMNPTLNNCNDSFHHQNPMMYFSSNAAQNAYPGPPPNTNWNGSTSRPLNEHMFHYIPPPPPPPPPPP